MRRVAKPLLGDKLRDQIKKYCARGKIFVDSKLRIGFWIGQRNQVLAKSRQLEEICYIPE